MSFKECELNVEIQGMTCHACELTIERAWKKIPGVKAVHVHAANGTANVKADETLSITQLREALLDTTYRVEERGVMKDSVVRRPSWPRLTGLLALVLLLGAILSRWGLLKGSFSVSQGMGFAAIFVIGLVAASSSCIAVTGGLLLSSSAKFNERYRDLSRVGRMRPVILFVAGRILSYALLGGLLGVIGKALSPSPFVTGFITILAALYMLMMGLEMLHIAPRWIKRLFPKFVPKSLSHRVLDADKKDHPIMPFLLGAATFFLPCGFTQALQLYALTTNSFWVGSSALLAFALGTAPALLALGYASSSLKGKAGRWFFQFSGVLVIVLGLWNIQNGLTVIGHPITLPALARSTVSQRATGFVPMDGSVQLVQMTVSPAGYSPARFTLRQGVRTRWEIDGTYASGCANMIISRQLGIQKILNPGINVIEFTPTQTGQVAFSCSMGMYRGSFTVVPST